MAETAFRRLYIAETLLIIRRAPAAARPLMDGEAKQVNPLAPE